MKSQCRSNTPTLQTSGQRRLGRRYSSGIFRLILNFSQAVIQNIPRAVDRGILLVRSLPAKIFAFGGTKKIINRTSKEDFPVLAVGSEFECRVCNCLTGSARNNPRGTSVPLDISKIKM